MQKGTCMPNNVYLWTAVWWIQLHWILIRTGSRILAQFRSGSGLCYTFWKQIILERSNFIWKNIFFNYKKMAPEELFSRLSHWIGNLCPNSYTFGLYYILYLHVWMWTHKASEKGSNTDPDPQHWWTVWLLGVLQ